MSLNLKEAEVAAYLDPSQENLAVYVKLLEAELEDRGNLAGELAEMRRELGAAPSLDDHIDLQNRITELEDELDALRGVGK